MENMWYLSGRDKGISDKTNHHLSTPFFFLIPSGDLDVLALTAVHVLHPIHDAIGEPS